MNSTKSPIYINKIDNINYLKSNKSDITSLLALAYYASFPKKLINKNFIDEKFNALLEYIANNQCHLLLATTNNKAIGLCHYFIKDDFEGKRGHLNQIAVLPDFQGSKYTTNAIIGGGDYANS
ncbi:hypothetical protein CCY99_09150 [Helicobacter sp. 16-1353]|uniref:GNAT family N-acetyltransferase n=1 Tax=Helicobacter sp. 16-1353 TaxID=2004996 RepID=UPI000DCD81FA|nr:GNAT family N-acetyltransferase [Helicobacter sp. 16-1353]RAX51435.1 hypothetical protein CCY99_09150 [Helicobacter sp. 16-1353]